MDADVADGGGEMRPEAEEDLRLAPAVGPAGDALPEREDGHQLAVGDERDGDHGLQHRHLPRDLAGGRIGGAAVGLVDLDQAPLGGQPERQPRVGGEGQGLHHVGHQAPEGAHPVLAPVLVGEEDRAPARPHHLGHRVQEQVEHARQVEPGGERLGELLGHLGEGVRGGLQPQDRSFVAVSGRCASR